MVGNVLATSAMSVRTSCSRFLTTSWRLLSASSAACRNSASKESSSSLTSPSRTSPGSPGVTLRGLRRRAPRSGRRRDRLAGARHGRHHRPQRLRSAEQPGRLDGYDELGVVAHRDLAERLELQHREQLRRHAPGVDRLVDDVDRSGTTLADADRRLAVALRPQHDALLCRLGLEDRRLLARLRAEDGGLPVTLGAQHRRLLLALCGVDRSLLLPFGLEDRRPLLLVGLL